MMATATSPRPRRHHRSSTGSSFDAGSASAAFAPLAVPRRASTSQVRPPRVRRAAFQVGGSSESDEDDCPLVKEVNQRAREAKLDDEHFGDFSYDAEAHRAADTTPNAEVPFPVLSPSPTRANIHLPPLTIPDREATPVARCSSSPTLAHPPKPTTVPSSASSTNSFNSGASTPIYLKNGRQLKPSLKSRVSLSLSTPDMASIRAHAKSAPSTPRVHFPTRERLESVVLFDKRARPLEVAAGDSPSVSPRFYDDEDGAVPGLRMRPQSSFPFPNMSPRGSSSNLQGFSAALMAKTKLKIALSRSAQLQPVPHPDAHVQLAAMRLLATRLSGSVLVKNVSFNKRVSVRYTFDNWETTSEVSAAWSSPNALADLPKGELKPFGEEETELDVARGIMVPVPAGWDRFTFNIKLDDVAPYLSARSLLIAVKFEAYGVGEWWDSCGGRNYRFEFDHVPRKEKKEEPKKEEPTTPKPVGRPRSNTSPAPLNSDATISDPASASLLSAKLSEVVAHSTPERPTLKLQFPSDESVKTEDSTPTPKAVQKPLTPPDSTSSSPRSPPAELPQPQPKPVTQVQSLPSPEDSPSSGRRQSSPLPSPSVIEAPAHSTTNVKDQSYADFLAKYCFAGAAPAASPRPTSTSPPAYGGFNSFGAPHSSFHPNPTAPTPSSTHTNFGWGSSGNAWSSVGFNYGTSFSGGDL